jgi:hypothetical protein
MALSMLFLTDRVKHGYTTVYIQFYFNFNTKRRLNMYSKQLTAAISTGLLTLGGANLALAHEKSADSLEDKLKEHLTISGSIEVEASSVESFDGSKEEDISLATADFGIEAKLVDWAVGTLALTWDDEEDKITVDEAFIALGGTEAIPASLKAGRFYLPFGVFETAAISDPLTLEAFETREDAVMVGFSATGLSGGLYVFNGDTNEGGGDEKIEHFGAHLGYSLENDHFKINSQLGYLSSIVDSDTLGEELDLEADYVGGIAAQVSVASFGVTLTGEYITAVEDYTTADGVEGKPVAYHLEAGYEVELGLPLQFALSYSATKDLAPILPESRVAAVVGVELVEGLGFKVEYRHDKDYDVADGGTGEEADAVVAQLSYEFSFPK